MARTKMIWVIVGMVGLIGAFPAEGMVMGTGDLLNGVGDFDTSAQQGAWTISGYGETVSYKNWDRITAPYAAFLQTDGAVNSYAQIDTNVTTVKGRLHQIDFWAERYPAAATFGSLSFGDSGWLTNFAFDNTYTWYNFSRIGILSGSGTGVANLLFEHKTRIANYSNNILLDAVRVYRELADPLVTGQSQTDVNANGTAALSLTNGGGTSNNMLVAFDPDVTVSWVSGVAVAVNSFSWTTDNQLSVDLTAGATPGMATLRVTNPYGGQTADFNINVIPEPVTLALLTLGGLIFSRRKG